MKCLTRLVSRGTSNPGMDHFAGVGQRIAKDQGRSLGLDKVTMGQGALYLV